MSQRLATIALMIAIMRDSLRRELKQSSEGSLYSTQTIPHKRKKTEIEKAVCLLCDSGDYKDKLTATGEHHSGSNNSTTKHVESLTESWK